VEPVCDTAPANAFKCLLFEGRGGSASTTAASSIPTTVPSQEQDGFSPVASDCTTSTPTGASSPAGQYGPGWPAAAEHGEEEEVFRMLQEGEAIEDFFEFGSDIYRASIRHQKDRVVAARRRSDDLDVAVKIRMKRPSGAGERAWREIMLALSRIGSSVHVLDTLTILEDSQAYYVVMPRCRGGGLLEFLTVEAEVPESECKRITQEILLGVGHLHRHCIIHRDIKPENIVFGTSQDERTVKLLDWDTCVKWDVGSPKRRSFAGTPGYIAPEVLLGKSSPQSDLFSVGVIFYILMTGLLPWCTIASLEDGLVGSPSAWRMYNMLRGAELDWEMEPWPQFPLARDLCQQLLAFEPSMRPASVDEVLKHGWFTQE